MELWMATKSFVFRFADIEVREREFTLAKAGEVVPVEPKAFRVLLMLLRNPGRLISKQELLEAVWGDAAVTENSLARAVALLRKLLGDEVRTPRFIETVATIGYRFIGKVEALEDTPEIAPLFPMETEGDIGNQANPTPAPMPAAEVVARSASSGRWKFAWLAVGVAVAVSAIWFLRRPLPTPQVTEYVPITHEWQKKGVVGTDGSRVYFAWDNEQHPVAEVAVGGGKIEPIPIALPNPSLCDVSADGSALLICSEDRDQQSLWSLQVPGGSLRRVAGGRFWDAAWSPDETTVAWLTPDGEVYAMKSNGTGAHRLAASVNAKSPSPSDDLAWSPDGKRIRFTASDGRIWDMFADGSRLHPLLAGWHASARLCCGRWTSDGRYFFFLMREPFTNPLLPASQIWVMDERHALLRRALSEPVPLTSGPTRWSRAVAAKDGKRIFADGLILRGELVRFNAHSGRFELWLGGISAEFVAFSPDGTSVAYVTFPDGILWRANRDGSNPVQLTSSPFYPMNPRWSPDGSRILFGSATPAGNWRSYTVAVQGGSPQLVLPADTEDETDPNWSPDGRRIVFTSGEWGRGKSHQVLKILDLASNRIVTMPGSLGMWSPRWSPNGRYIAAMVKNGGISIFDVKTGQWHELQRGEQNYPTFSSDSRYVYFLDLFGHGVYRVPVTGGDPQRIVDLKEFRYTGSINLWMGLDPNDTPLLIRDAGSDEIYALTLEEK
jgi:DNA-binding winged helix-turn-helix (wHTH) protein/Tol biopolymer transport system component